MGYPIGYGTNHKVRDWLIYTVIMGVLPSIIRLVVYLLFHKTLSPNDFYTELFFATIVLLFDALRNFRISSGWRSITSIALCLGSIVYGFIFADSLNFLKEPLSKPIVSIFTWVFLGTSIALDALSLRE